MKKTKEELINDYKKSNYERRQRIAELNGFKSGEEYLNSLMKPVKTPTIKTTGGITRKVTGANRMKGIFYVIDILDATGSMAGGKYDNSKKGIIDGIKDLAPRKDVKYSLTEFIESYRDLNHAVVLQIPSDIKTNKIKFSGAIGGNTPLYKTVYDVIDTTSVKKMTRC